MTETQDPKRYDLEDRTLIFSREVIDLMNGIPNTIANVEIIKQIVRSASSVGANYIEANGALGKKDFAMRIKICRKEAKESKYWLNLINVNKVNLEQKRQGLVREADELTRIFSAILNKTSL